LATRADGASDPAERCSFVFSPESEVEDDVGVQLRGPHAELDQLAFNEVALIWWVLIAKQHDLPLVCVSRRADALISSSFP